jgi:chaperone modulatory protein CbpM
MKTIKQIIFLDVIVGENWQLTLTEFHERYHVTEDVLRDMLEEGLFHPRKIDKETLYLDLKALQRIRTAWHLQRDLGVNLPGAALALDLLQELEELRQELASLHH